MGGYLRKLVGFFGVVAAVVGIEYSYFLWQVQKQVSSATYDIFFILAMLVYIYSFKYILRPEAAERPQEIRLRMSSNCSRLLIATTDLKC